MNKRTKEIKYIIITTAVIILLTIIGLVVFLFNVDIKPNGQIDLSELQQKNEVSNNYTAVTENSVVTTAPENEGATYDLIENDYDGVYQIILNQNNLYFNVVDKEEFAKKYPKSDIDVNNYNQISASNYKIQDINVGKIKDTSYLVLSLEEQEVVLLDLDKAISESNLVVENEVIRLGKNVKKIENVIKSVNDKQENTIILCTSDGQNYDLSNFVE